MVHLVSFNCITVYYSNCTIILCPIYIYIGGLTGAGARITGTFGDVFAKLTFDDDFIDRRQQEKTKTSSKLGLKAFGFLKVRYAEIITTECFSNLL